ADYQLNSTNRSYTTLMYYEAHVNNELIILILDSGEQKRPLGEVDQFSVTVGGKTITLYAVVTEAGNYIPANINERIMGKMLSERKPKAKNKEKSNESDVEEDKEINESDENEETNESDNNKALLNQEYLFYKMQPMLDGPAKLCGCCIKKKYDAIDCILEKK
ncbi:5534_t:CDS:2, partial [Ambispora leptoticha]